MKRLAFFLFILVSSSAGFAQDFFPVAVWYGGGKARAPMLERDVTKHREAWRRDLQQIKSLGFNTVKMWADWATTEPVRGQYRTDYVDQMLDLAEEVGLRVEVQIYTDSAPEWLGKLYPDAAFVTHLGTKIVSQASPGFCMDNPGVRADMGKFISVLAEHVAKRKAFYAWDLWSEPHIVNWVWMNFPVEFCYCPYTQARFRDWLRERYGDLNHLNASWYRTFSDWSEVQAPHYDTILSYTDFIDWKSFVADKLEGDLKFKAESVRRVRSDFVATSHADNAGVLMNPVDGYGNPDDWHMNRSVDFFGLSLYPKHASALKPWGPVRFASAVDGAFSASGGRGFFVGELQAGQGATGVRVAEPVTGADMRIWALTAIAHGAKAINFYAYYTMSSGYESNGYGMIELDGKVTQRAREAGQMAKVVDANQKLILGAHPRRAEVGIVYDWLSYFTGGNTVGPGNNVRDSMMGIYRAFYGRNIPAEFVHNEQLANAAAIARYKAIFLPYPLMLNREAAAGLKEYVRNGGTVISEARPAWNDERGFANDRIPGGGLDEVFGVREALVRTVETTTIKLSRAVGSLNEGDSVNGVIFEEHLEVTGKADVLARFAGGQPAITSAAFGKGRAILVGSFLGIENEKHPDSPAGSLYVTLAEQAGVKAPVTLNGQPGVPDVEARVMDGNGYRLLFLLNQSGKRQTGHAALPDAKTARDWFTGETKHFPLQFDLAPLDTMVVEVRD